MFFKYVASGDAFGRIVDLELAKQVVDTYAHYLPSEQFEVLRVGNNETDAQKDGFMGFDIVSGFNLSYLYNELDICTPLKTDLVEPRRLYNQADPLICLLESFFRSKLNRYSLFSDFATASFCLECVMALDVAFPNIWDNPKTYSVIGLSLVYPQHHAD
jgi:hypothetical protein